MTDIHATSARLRTSMFAALALLAVVCTTSADATFANSDTRPAARSGAMACAVGERIYTTGGASVARNGKPRFDLWNPRKNKWKSLPAPQHKRSLGAMISVGRRIYLIGGINSDGKVITDIEVFNTSTNDWEEAISDPVPGSRIAAVAVDSRIYIIGGIEGDVVHSTQVRSFDTATRMWTAHPPLSLGRHGHAAAVLDGRIYVTGGYAQPAPERSEQTNTVEVFDPAANEWSAGPALAKPHAFHCIAAIDNALYVCGTRGEDRTLEVLKQGADKWLPGPPMPVPRHRSAAAVLGSKLFIFDGEDETGDIQPSLLIYDAASKAWQHRHE